MKQMVASIILCLFLCMCSVVEGRRQVLRNKRMHSSDKVAINRHRALFYNRRQNPYADTMDRIRIRDRLSLGSDTVTRPTETVVLAVAGADAQDGFDGFRRKMSYYRGDDFFQQEYQDDVYRGSKSKTGKGMSKSKASKASKGAMAKQIVIIQRREYLRPLKSVLLRC